MTLFYKTCAAYKILLAFQMFKKTIFCDEELKKRETQRKTFFLNVPSFTPGIYSPCCSKGLHGFLIYKQLELQEVLCNWEQHNGAW